MERSKWPKAHLWQMSPISVLDETFSNFVSPPPCSKTVSGGHWQSKCQKFIHDKCVPSLRSKKYISFSPFLAFFDQCILAVSTCFSCHSMTYFRWISGFSFKSFLSLQHFSFSAAVQLLGNLIYYNSYCITVKMVNWLRKPRLFKNMLHKCIILTSIWLQGIFFVLYKYSNIISAIFGTKQTYVMKWK